MKVFLKFLTWLIFALFVIGFSTQFFNLKFAVLGGMLNVVLAPLGVLSLVASFRGVLVAKVKWPYIIILMLAIALFLPLVKISSIEKHSNASIKVLSLNASFFKIPNWYYKGGDPNKSTEGFHEIQNWINYQNADVICLQEFYTDDFAEEFDNISFFKQNGYLYHCLYSNPKHKNGIHGGLAIFSKTPIVSHQTGAIIKSRYNGLLAADILINRDTLTFVNVHLESLEAYKLLKKKKYPGHILKEYAAIEAARDEQFGYLKTFLNKEKTVIAGDFNATRFNYKHFELKRFMKDAFGEAGQGMGATYKNPFRIPMQLDRQYCSKDLNVNSCTIGYDLDWSDHYGVVATYSF